MLLASGQRMPIIGLGTYKLASPEPVKTALELGYRHFDCASHSRLQCLCVACAVTIKRTTLHLAWHQEEEESATCSPADVGRRGAADSNRLLPLPLLLTMMCMPPCAAAPLPRSPLLLCGHHLPPTPRATTTCHHLPPHATTRHHLPPPATTSISQGAAFYGNEVLVGAGLADFLAAGRRDELFITSKVWNTHHKPADARSVGWRCLLWELLEDGVGSGQGPGLALCVAGTPAYRHRPLFLSYRPEGDCAPHLHPSSPLLHHSLLPGGAPQGLCAAQPAGPWTQAAGPSAAALA